MSSDTSKLEQLKELAQLEPDDPVVHYGLGVEYLRAGDPQNAAAALRRAVELKPDYSAAYRERGKALAKLGQSEEARATYEEGKRIAQQKGDLQTAKEIEVFLRRLSGGHE